MKDQVFSKLTAFLDDLERRQIGYHLAHYRDEAVMVLVALPGERWEIEFLADGSVEIEKFMSSGEVHGENVLNELFARYLNEDDSDSSEEAKVITSDRRAA
jgi:hypothetical protein